MQCDTNHVMAKQHTSNTLREIKLDIEKRFYPKSEVCCYATKSVVAFPCPKHRKPQTRQPLDLPAHWKDLVTINYKASNVETRRQNVLLLVGSSNVGLSIQDIVDVSGTEGWKVYLSHIVTGAGFLATNCLTAPELDDLLMIQNKNCSPRTLHCTVEVSVVVKDSLCDGVKTGWLQEHNPGGHLRRWIMPQKLFRSLWPHCGWMNIELWWYQQVLVVYQ